MNYVLLKLEVINLLEYMAITTPSSVVTSMTKMLGYIPDVVLMGHRHTNGFSRPDNVSVIASGCLSGMDDYAMENRLVGTPEQMAFLVTDKKPIDRIFNITFDGR